MGFDLGVIENTFYRDTGEVIGERRAERVLMGIKRSVPTDFVLILE